MRLRPNVVTRDPYGWMDKAPIVDDTELGRLVAAEAAYARAKLAGPLRDSLYPSVCEAVKQMNAAPREVTWRETQQFYWRVPEGADAPKLFTRKGLDGDETLIFDPATQSPVADQGLNVYAPFAIASSVSPDGRHVVIPLSKGDENHQLIVVDTKTGAVLPDVLGPSSFGAIVWLDGSTIVYSRMQLSRGATKRPEDVYSNMRLYRHAIGTSMAEDVLVFGDGVRADKPFPTHCNLDVRVAGDNVYGTVRDGVRRELDVFIASRATFSSGQPSWRKLIDASRGVVDFAEYGDDLIAMVAGRREREHWIVRLPRKSDIDWKHAKTIVAGTDTDVTDMHLQGDALYVTQMTDAKTEELVRVPLDGGPPCALFSVEGTIEAVSELPAAYRLPAPDADRNRVGLLVEAISWKAGYSQFYRVDDNGIATLIQSHPEPEDFSPQLAVTLRYAENPDGSRPVPVVLVHRKGLDMSRPHIAKLTAYGGYGARITPAGLGYYIDLASLALAHDVVLAYADVHRGAADEVNAAAQMLIREQYTSAPLLTGCGRSRGGATVGLAAALHPELYGRLLLEHGMVDTVGHEFTANGPGNTSEFGAARTQRELKAKQRTNPNHLLPKENFPDEIMLTIGLNDNRVDPRSSCKLTAALRHASEANGRQRDVLLRVDPDAGHFEPLVSQQLTYQMDTAAFTLGALRQRK
ncbi:prolyl oligopeptidase family serine peptidase [Trinickia sp. LjRoot230]